MKNLILSAAFLAAPAVAEPFTILIYETEADLKLRTDVTSAGADYWAAYARYAEVLQKSGAIRSGAPLQLPQTARSFSAGDSGGRAGAAVRGPLQLGGYFVIEADSIEQAGALAAQSPSVIRGGAAEVRAAFPAPAMR